VKVTTGFGDGAGYLVGTGFGFAPGTGNSQGSGDGCGVYSVDSGNGHGVGMGHCWGRGAKDASAYGCGSGSGDGFERRLCSVRGDTVFEIYNNRVIEITVKSVNGNHFFVRDEAEAVLAMQILEGHSCQ
jgi:hypothetical protein